MYRRNCGLFNDLLQIAISNDMRTIQGKEICERLSISISHYHLGGPLPTKTDPSFSEEFNNLFICSLLVFV